MEDKKYIPEAGDVISFCDEEYVCIQSNATNGVVNPIGETFYLRNFYWEFKGEYVKFIRKSTQEELSKLGLC